MGNIDNYCSRDVSDDELMMQFVIKEDAELLFLDTFLKEALHAEA